MLRACRMADAEQLLCSDSGVNPSRVCEAVGGHDTVQFIRDFKAQYGMTTAKCKWEKAQEKNSGNVSYRRSLPLLFHIMIRMFC